MKMLLLSTLQLSLTSPRLLGTELTGWLHGAKCYCWLQPYGLTTLLIKCKVMMLCL